MFFRSITAYKLEIGSKASHANRFITIPFGTNYVKKINNNNSNFANLFKIYR